MNVLDSLNSFREQVASQKEEKRWLRIVLNKYAIVTFLFLIWMCFLDNNNIGVWFRARRKLKEQDRQIEYLRKEIDRTETRLEQLHSKDSLEKFAREEYHFHEDGEDVYIVK